MSGLSTCRERHFLLECWQNNPKSEEDKMKKLFGFLLAGLFLFLAANIGACSYGGVAMNGDKVVILRNDAFLFGLLRKVYVCKLEGSNLSCSAAGGAP